jgi:phospholipid-binding lipoprotein MlaA
VIALNKVTFAATQAVDRAVIEPAAKAYGKNIPYPIRAGLRHFFTNPTEPVVALNFLLQLKPGKAAETLGRFALNSTVGIGGLLDVAVAKPFKLPYRRNGFANTMAYYGVGPGPFLFVPLVGPTTARRDRPRPRSGVPARDRRRPAAQPYYVTGSFVVRSLNDRLDDDRRIQAMRKSGDPYLATKEAYLAARQAQIDELKGRKPKPAPAQIAPTPAPAPAPSAAEPARAPDGQVLPPIVLPAPAAPATGTPVPAPPCPEPGRAGAPFRFAVANRKKSGKPSNRAIPNRLAAWALRGGALHPISAVSPAGFGFCAAGGTDICTYDFVSPAALARHRGFPRHGRAAVCRS